jgi:hypothetical protein
MLIHVYWIEWHYTSRSQSVRILASSVHCAFNNARRLSRGARTLTRSHGLASFILLYVDQIALARSFTNRYISTAVLNIISRMNTCVLVDCSSPTWGRCCPARLDIDKASGWKGKFYFYTNGSIKDFCWAVPYILSLVFRPLNSLIGFKYSIYFFKSN